ncbi:oligosaccharide repeat unit polymerase [Myroides odoratimimus]|uniref:O-antigen polymerase n=1 Tax=Myroides odoratimimus TaxID=76832 RepID=UPI0025787A49|nr:O-antigen polymerase [Myroides odoratimimus]MDM1033762.1 oligosaccharide repeat unit polymerase [Myroides odoratimimus]
MLAIYIFFFGAWFIYNYRIYGINVSTFIIGLYLLSAISGFILLYAFDFYDPERILVKAIFTHIICLFLFLYPVVYVGNKGLKNVIFPGFTQLRYLIFILIFLGLVTIITSVENVQKVFSFTDLSEARKLYNAREIDVTSTGIFGYLAGIGTHLAYYSIFFFFYLLAFFPQKKLLIVLLFISSFGNIFYNLSAMGRDGLVRWMLFIIINYLLYKDYLSISLKAKIKKMSFIPLVAILLVFFMITFSRFGDRQQGVMFYIFDYIGQQNIYFSYNFDQFFEGAAGGRLNFGYFLGDSISMNNLNDIFYADYHLNTFSTFVGSFYFDTGFLTTLLLSIFFYIISFCFIKIGKFTFTKFVVFLIFLEIELLGIFYYMFYAPTRINTLLLLIIISFCIYFISKYKSTLIKIR